MDQHLVIHELILEPSGEWKPDARGWTIMRVAEGVGYCMHAAGAMELNADDTLVCGAAGDVIVRASQLGALKLDFFFVLPQLLNGVLTAVEWQCIEDAARKKTSRLMIFHGQDLMAQKFKRLAVQKRRDDLALRSALLQFWASTLTGILPESTSGASGSLQLRDRFRELISKLPTSELAVAPLTELAERLHCSERHLSRMFREEFKVSLRTWQTEQRLQQASKLLLSTDQKVANVAKESGYQHVGLFNSLFKKRFGHTPSAWREKMGLVASVSLLSWLGAAQTPELMFFSQLAEFLA
jgi:AraC-like DNA-binding protein